MEAGYDVTATTSVQQALELPGREIFDAVIIGHRFLKEEKKLLAVEAKEKSNIPIVLVCGATRDSEMPATRRVYALGGSAGLLFALSALFSPGVEVRPQAA